MMKQFDIRLETALMGMTDHMLATEDYVADIIFAPEQSSWYYDLERLRREVASIADSDFLDIVVELQQVFMRCKEKVQNASLDEEQKDQLIFEISKRESEFAFTDRMQKIKKVYED